MYIGHISNEFKKKSDALVKESRRSESWLSVVLSWLFGQK